MRGAGLVQMYREGGAAYYEAIEGHPLLDGLRRLIDSADDLDEMSGRWYPPFEEVQRRNQRRYREQQRARAESAATYDERAGSKIVEGAP